MERLKENIVIAKFGKTFQFSDNHFNDLELKDEVIDLIKEEDVFSLTVLDKAYSLVENIGITKNETSFLKTLHWIKNITISKLNIDLNGLTYLTNLEKLLLGESTTKPVDFTFFKELKEAELVWTKERDSILECESLETLILRSYKLKDLKDFNKLKNLKNLTLVSSSIENLEGLENLVNLEVLELHFDSKLEDLTALSKCTKLKRIRLANLPKIQNLSTLENCKSLECIIVENCKKVSDNKALFTLSNLKIFSYSNSGEFESIKGIDNLVQLERFAISDTNIIDGNLDPLLKLKKLIFCFFKDKKHYSLKLQEVKTKLGIA
ncbi:MAG: hypothetical protein PSX42_11245 [bacterium]|nr:hypothetical protein [bacterium]